MRRRALADGTREMIRTELEESHRDRAKGPHPRPDKAERFARAIAALDRGALEVEVEHALWRVTGEPRPPQFITVQRDREGILAELHDGLAVRVGSDATAAFEDAVAAIELGGLTVFAGGVLYRVVEG